MPPKSKMKINISQPHFKQLSLNKKNIKTRGGFTLIELLIVVLLIGVLSGILLMVLDIPGLRKKTGDAVRLANINKLVLGIRAYDAAEGIIPSSKDDTILRSLYIKAWPNGSPDVAPNEYIYWTNGTEFGVRVGTAVNGVCFKYYSGWEAAQTKRCGGDTCNDSEECDEISTGGVTPRTTPGTTPEMNPTTAPRPTTPANQGCWGINGLCLSDCNYSNVSQYYKFRDEDTGACSGPTAYFSTSACSNNGSGSCYALSEKNSGLTEVCGVKSYPNGTCNFVTCPSYKENAYTQINACQWIGGEARSPEPTTAVPTAKPATSTPISLKCWSSNGSTCDTNCDHADLSAYYAANNCTATPAGYQGTETLCNGTGTGKCYKLGTNSASQNYCSKKSIASGQCTNTTCAATAVITSYTTCQWLP